MKGDKTMARGKSQSTTKSNLEEVRKKFDGFANAVVLRAEIKKVLLDTDKVNKYSIAVPSETTKHNVSYAYLNLTEFVDNEKPYDVGSLIHIEGHISSDSYEKDGKKFYTTDIIADKIKEIYD